MTSAMIYEDNDVLVVHKPAGIATQTARLGQADIESELKNYLKKSGQTTYLGVVHRLDQPVEGLLVFAKTPAAAASLSAALQKGTLKKSYHALVYGACKSGGELTDYLVRDGRTNLSHVASAKEKDAKQARLTWQLCKHFSHDGIHFSLIQIELQTGRHHQIRVQMSHADMPLLGDNKYGTSQSQALSEALGIRSTALLASTLSFPQPTSGRRLDFTLPLPWKLDSEVQ